MSTAATRYEHIVLDDHGVPTIAGTTMKVVELVLDRDAHGWSAEELKFQHPYLSLGQIHSALAFYWDHQAELDSDISRRVAKMDQIRQSVSLPPLLARKKPDN
jgi:uncharacterized protein (DUF433 family)